MASLLNSSLIGLLLGTLMSVWLHGLGVGWLTWVFVVLLDGMVGWLVSYWFGCPGLVARE